MKPEGCSGRRDALRAWTPWARPQAQPTRAGGLGSRRQVCGGTCRGQSKARRCGGRGGAGPRSPESGFKRPGAKQQRGPTAGTLSPLHSCGWTRGPGIHLLADDELVGHTQVGALLSVGARDSRGVAAKVGTWGDEDVSTGSSSDK